jgi:DNA-binding transcriptional LysR family regulator
MYHENLGYPITHQRAAGGARAICQSVLAAGSVVLRSSSTNALLAAARASIGVAVLPRLVANVYADLIAVSPDLHDSESGWSRTRRSAAIRRCA